MHHLFYILIGKKIMDLHKIKLGELFFLAKNDLFQMIESEVQGKSNYFSILFL